jgi:putative endonuclease
MTASLKDLHLMKTISAKYYYIYILHCNNDNYYTGYTTDMVRRYQKHINGDGSKYTRSFKPLNIAQCWQFFGTKSFAMKIENYIKALSKKEKIHLIQFPEKLAEVFQCVLIYGIKNGIKK